MNVIKRNETVKAFRNWGFEPVQRSYLRDGTKCCGLTAIAVHRQNGDLTSIKTTLRSINSRKMVDYLSTTLNLDKEYTLGFIHGWDNKETSLPKVQSYWDGWRDGIISWQAVQIDRLTNSTHALEQGEAGHVA